MRIFRNQFFKTKEEALAFKKEKGYQADLAVLGRFDDEFIAEYLYVVAWTQHI